MKLFVRIRQLSTIGKMIKIIKLNLLLTSNLVRGFLVFWAQFPLKTNCLISILNFTKTK